ncbi:histidine phosphotransferase family protein [Pontivivens insulae]|uniref:Histidine phosphotransferase ChpT C-terminal domain-containing protein n=1 Tax=Pontivivens insulae TaxID=1639689 RepID=A0A2R8ADT9_9RHOB|nr:histidine phosphotransferase family protein [Pontivivens insulae]RED14163.1 histidine phosphotransferase ChpT [Pontivivens insulae]SPF30238.1 hypothetical protein POI8812_02574 [Pontivivens insulae]
MSVALATVRVSPINALDAMSVSEPQQSDLAALVTARICHDLVSSVGAVDNGVELISSLGAAPQPADLAMIAESARTATLRMRMFRVAFGPHKGAAIDAAHLHECCKTALSRPRLSLDWHLDQTALPQPEGQLLLLLVMCAESAMARGGTLEVRHDAEGITLKAVTERPRIDADVWAWLDADGPSHLPAPGQVHFAFAHIAAERIGWHLAWSSSGDQLTVAARRPD